MDNLIRSNHEAHQIATRAVSRYRFSIMNQMPSGLRWVAGRDPGRTLRRATVLAACALLTFGGIFRPVVIRGRSMEPTLSNGSWHLATRWWADCQRQPKRQDILVIRRAGGRFFYVKRVLALPHETIAFRGGTFWIDDRPLQESYLKTRSDWEMPPFKLGADQYFVAGDNRVMPMADHTAGVVERKNFAGRIWR